jgi:hypothetical protein
VAGTRSQWIVGILAIVVMVLIILLIMLVGPAHLPIESARTSMSLKC